jgi:hypothetical protein
MLKFTDGVEFNTSGILRIEEKFDGFYVLGEGWLIPVTGQEEGERVIAKLKNEIMQ